MHNRETYDLQNRTTGMSIWLANPYYGTSFTIDGKKYGGVTFMSSFFGGIIPWRRELHYFASKMTKRREVRKWGVQWERMTDEESQEWLQ